jgi:IS5 family transposase
MVAQKKGRLKAMADGLKKDLLREWERRNAQVRARVEHPFHIVKNLFGYRKVRYRGLRKNLA